MRIQNGDIVTRRSYNHDVLFCVSGISAQADVAELTGEQWRLLADAPMDDLTVLNREQRRQRRKKIRKKEERSYQLFRQDYQQLKLKREYTASGGYARENTYFELPGRVLHIDGDPYYLTKCLELYEKLGVPVTGRHVKEVEMSAQIGDWFKKFRPNILVITGHDAYMKNKGKKSELDAYRHSRDFLQAVQAARHQEGSLDDLVIFAGACQSHFESLIRAGCNYASSPGRINIHALDPVYIAAKVSLTSFMDRVTVWDALRNTLAGEKGIGGLETKGILRTGMPIQNNQDGADLQP